MIVDLHSHYPLQLLAGKPMALDLMLSGDRRAVADKLRAFALRIANHWNYPSSADRPGVTIDGLQASRVRVVLSALFTPFDEIDLQERYGAPPRPEYLERLLEQIDLVERSLAGHEDAIAVARGPAEISRIVAEGKVALVHAVEGAYPLGENVLAVRAAVRALAARGVATITVAHLFWRQVATNTPAIPFLPDFLYRWLFPQPALGLTVLGRAAVRCMVENGILVDLTHMSRRAFTETMQVLDEVNPGRTVPVLVSHTACAFTGRRYNVTDEQIAAVASRRGVVGLMACRHHMAIDRTPRTFAEAVDVLCRHVDRLHRVTGSHDFTALGSDQDGFIKPALPGLETPVGLGRLEEELGRRYGAEVAAAICAGNALRVLGYWTVRPGEQAREQAIGPVA